ncbi:hypothetical protein [Saccharospirillum salsuginis]|uniref:Pre-peptidase C-terminal domain-containing protein n=1 Tax=Saccharospirillum salsuginis TaxID=418750 RepID=A0A918KKE0_9GAMM|nr:hypothetical protein [Saccharospirillum salsuginis]GGX66657.1 hypothetical protein GCM10007392_38000 [Saccharospirillum salsuginis]
MDVQFRFALIPLLAGLLVGCNSGGGGDDGGDDGGNGSSASSATSGSAQKGPFQMGQTVTATRLKTDGSLSGDTATTETTERGEFEFTDLNWAGGTQLSIEGTFYDEIGGNFTGTDRTLLAVTDLEDGQSLSTNVNLYTHFIAKRVRHLMGQGTAFAASHDQARGELQSAFAIDSAPSDLNLLQTIDGTSEEDSANLLMFSAALLKAGIDQNGLDAMADDFADDGAINGDGVDELSEVNAEQDDTLLSAARLNLKNQYSTEPPNSGGSGFGWILDECALQTLNETSRPVFCTSQDEQAEFNRSNDPGETRFTSVFVSEKPGHYWLEVSVDAEEDSPSFNSWELFGDDDEDTPHFCENRGYNNGTGDGNQHAEGRTDRLDINEAHCLESYISPSFGSDGPNHILVNWFLVSEGGSNLREAVELTLGSTHRGTVGNTVSTAQDMPAYSYYQFTVKQSGDYSILADNYSNGGSGSLRIALFADEDDSGGITFYNDQERVDFIGGPGTDSTSTEMVKSLSAGTYAVRIFNGTNYRGDSDSNPLEFDIEVTKQ